MVMAYKIKPAMRDVIPAVTHGDGTGRLQTVEKDVNPLYWKLIRRFGDVTAGLIAFRVIDPARRAGRRVERHPHGGRRVEKEDTSTMSGVALKFPVSGGALSRQRFGSSLLSSAKIAPGADVHSAPPGIVIVSEASGVLARQTIFNLAKLSFVIWSRGEYFVLARSPP